MKNSIDDYIIYSGEYKGRRLGDMSLGELKHFATTQVFETLNLNIKNWVRYHEKRKYHLRDFWDEWCEQAGVNEFDENDIFTYDEKQSIF